MPRYRLFFVLTLLTIILGCSGLRVSQDYDVTTSFSGLKTYDWQSEGHKKTGDIRVDNPLLHIRIRSAIDQSLLGRGFQRVFHRNPDFFVTYQYAVRSKTESNDMSTGVGFGIGSFGRYGGIGVSTGGSVSTYDEGILVIDIMDSKNGRLIWRGTGTRRISEHSDPKKLTQRVYEAVEKILAQFPPPS